MFPVKTNNVGWTSWAVYVRIPLFIFTTNSAAAGPSLTFTDNEKAAFDSVFLKYDPSHSGFVTGDAARNLFMLSGLQPVLLGQIWQLADPLNHGYLDKQGFYLALRVIGHVQSGRQLTQALTETGMFIPVPPK